MRAQLQNRRARFARNCRPRFTLRGWYIATAIAHRRMVRDFETKVSYPIMFQSTPYKQFFFLFLQIPRESRSLRSRALCGWFRPRSSSCGSRAYWTRPQVWSCCRNDSRVRTIKCKITENHINYFFFFLYFYSKRRGAINAKQLSFLEKYRPKSRLKQRNGHKNSCCVQ